MATRHGERREDEAIRAELRDRLQAAGLGEARIRVAVDDGRVRLTGEVHDRGQRERAEQLAASVAGTTEVDNALSVETSEPKDVQPPGT